MRVPVGRDSSGAVIATSEDRHVNAEYVLAVAIRFQRGNPDMAHERDLWVLELQLADGTTATRGCHTYRQDAERQRDALLYALGWRII